MDKMQNSYKNDFLSLILNNSLTILNGRTLGDIRGNFTCIKPNGCSVVDYFAVTTGLKCKIKHLKVLDLSLYSDHKPLILSLSMNLPPLIPSKPIDQVYEPAPPKFIIDEKGKAKFLQVQNSENFTNLMNEVKNSLNSIGPNPVPDTVSQLNEKHSTYLLEMANDCFRLTKQGKKQYDKTKPWYSKKCKIAKRELSKAARTTSKYSESDFLRESFYHTKKLYSKLINRCKNEFYNQINRDIESGKIINWQQFKRLKQYKTSKISFDCNDMENFEPTFPSCMTISMQH